MGSFKAYSSQNPYGVVHKARGKGRISIPGLWSALMYNIFFEDLNSFNNTDTAQLYGSTFRALYTTSKWILLHNILKKTVPNIFRITVKQQT